MHVHTIVKVHAPDADEALEIVRNLVTDFGEFKAYGSSVSAFDWCDEEAIKVLPEFTAEKFAELREAEESEATEYLRKAEDATNGMRGYYYKQVGECLDADDFWTSNRRVFEYAEDTDESDPVFYVETDRHF